MPPHRVHRALRATAGTRTRSATRAQTPAFRWAPSVTRSATVQRQCTLPCPRPVPGPAPLHCQKVAHVNRSVQPGPGHAPRRNKPRSHCVADHRRFNRFGLFALPGEVCLKEIQCVRLLLLWSATTYRGKVIFIFPETELNQRWRPAHVNRIEGLIEAMMYLVRLCGSRSYRALPCDKMQYDDSGELFATPGNMKLRNQFCGALALTADLAPNPSPTNHSGHFLSGGCFANTA